MMRKLLVPALVGLISLGLTTQVSADASPPLYPPGSAVLPPGETMVQMVSETVEINIAPTGARAEYEARFTMRNQGEATEQMDVRFPLTDGDSWETIWDFAAYIDGEQVRVRKSVEPFNRGDTRIARWAVFPVTFEPDVDVLITVTYSTYISGWGWGGDYDVGDSIQNAFFGSITPDTATVYYMLETGAGWYGPIESGVVTLRLPYPAGPVNVFDLDAGLAEGRLGWGWRSAEHFSGPIFDGDEARWEFAQLEPTREDNLSIQFLWPEEWERIQALEAEAEENPADLAIALELAGAYFAAGTSIHSGWANEYHCILSQQTIDRALVYHPASEELLEGLEIIAAFCPDLAAVQDEATATLTPVPATTSRPTELPTSTPAATPTSASITTTTAELVPTGAPEQPTPTNTPPGSAGDTSLAIQILVGLGAGALVVVVLAGMRGRKPPPGE
jgi:hypothetical protein